MSEVERLLRSALVPVEPPGSLGDRLETALTELTDAAMGELAEWDSKAMRDPRNWMRPVAAVVIGGAAAGALVVVRARTQHRGRARAAAALRRSARDVTGQVKKRLRR